MYSAFDSTFDGVSSVVLSDDSLGQEAVVIPGIGANCVSYRVTHSGNRIDVLYPPPDAETLRERPSGFGIPILFPWPNRIEDSRFTFDGRDVQLEVSDPARPHELHGFVMGRPWDVVEKGASEDDGAFVRCRFRSADFPEIEVQYPFAFEATATYVLKDGALSLTVAGLNTGSNDMPAGLGMHPYNPLPLANRGDRALCTIDVPADQYWPLREDCIPLGEISAVAGKYDLRQPGPIGDTTYDDVWTSVQTTNGWSACTVRDPHIGLSVTTEGDSAFREWVVYAPPDKPVICFEPYTCTTNAFNLQAKGVDAGMVRLKPGEALRGTMRIRAASE